MALLDVRNVTLHFRGVTALADVELLRRAGSIHAIIGPNGAGKTSLLNCISRRVPAAARRESVRRARHLPARALGRTRLGIARTFQNIALFKRHDRPRQPADRPPRPPARRVLLARPLLGPGQREEIAHRERVEDIIDFLEIAARPQARRGHARLRPAEAGGAGARAGARAAAAAPRRADGGHERRGEGGHGPLHPRHQRGARDHLRHDRARHGRGHGHLRPRSRCSTSASKIADGHARGGAAEPRGDQAPTWASTATLAGSEA